MQEGTEGWRKGWKEGGEKEKRGREGGIDGGREAASWWYKRPFHKVPSAEMFEKTVSPIMRL